MSLGCQEAFEVFKRDHADTMNSLIFDILNSDYSHFVSFTDHLKGKITQRHIQRAALGKRLNLYKTMFNRLKELKLEIEHLQLLMEKVKVKLQKDFEVWWSEEAINLQQLSAQSMLSPQSPAEAHHCHHCLFKNPGEIECSNLMTYVKNELKRCHFKQCIRSDSTRGSSTSIPLTGDSQADADILAFIKARQNILQKKGKSCQKIGSQTKTSSTVF
uniref:Kinesin-like protein KIF6/9 C-terminal domain-containing protein n=1 Tax=Strix occidentalis caurina TaxID=311401 RepID=A0A8D0FCT0_STROC